MTATHSQPADVRQAVILCGGIGSRLGALTAATLKPLLPVAETPFLERLLFEIGRFGIDRVLFLAAHRADDIRAFAAEACPRLGLTFEIAVEPDRAGTGGALWHAATSSTRSSSCSTATAGSTSTSSTWRPGSGRTTSRSWPCGRWRTRRATAP